MIAPCAILLASRREHDDLGDFLSFLSDRELEELKRDALSLIEAIARERDARERDRRAA
jgi:hypothetical protein